MRPRMAAVSGGSTWRTPTTDGTTDTAPFETVACPPAGARDGSLGSRTWRRLAGDRRRGRSSVAGSRLHAGLWVSPATFDAQPLQAPGTFVGRLLGGGVATRRGPACRGRHRARQRRRGGARARRRGSGRARAGGQCSEHGESQSHRGRGIAKVPCARRYRRHHVVVLARWARKLTGARQRSQASGACPAPIRPGQSCARPPARPAARAWWPWCRSSG